MWYARVRASISSTNEYMATQAIPGILRRLLKSSGNSPFRDSLAMVVVQEP